MARSREIFRMRRWVRLAGWAALGLAGLAAAGAGVQAAATARALRAHAPPGELVDVGGHRLHLRCLGEGRPVVVLEAGLFGSSLDWWSLQPELAAATRVCAYDRAGYGWSELGPRPRDAGRLAGELRALLRGAGVEGPYVLVGHSFGGHVVRVFAGRWPREVAGLVLVDASHEDLAARLPPEARRAWERQAGFFHLLPPMGRLGVARVIAMPMGMVARYPAAIREMAEAVGYRTDAYLAAAAEGLAFAASAAQARAAELPDVPLVVVAADGRRYEPHFVPAGISLDSLAPILLELQRDLARSTPRGTLVFAEESGHYVHLDRPALVRDAVLRVVAAAR